MVKLALFAALLLGRAALAGPPAAAPAGGKSPAEIRAAITQALSERHPTKGAAWWRALGPGAPDVIIAMSQSTDHVFDRLRLVEALGWYDSPAGTEYLKQQAQTTPDDVVRRAAVESIAESQGPREEDFVAKYLHHADPQTRYAAAHALQKIGDDRARELLKKYEADEKALWIVAKLKGQLPALTKPLPVTANTAEGLNRAFEGAWSGYWVYARMAAPGMQSRAVTLTLRVAEGRHLKGELVVKENAKSVSLEITQAQGQGDTASGRLAQTGRKALEFEAEMGRFDRGGAHEPLLMIRTPELGGEILLRKTVQR